MNIRIVLATFCAVALLVAAPSAWSASNRISAVEAYQKVVNGSLTLIDIRSPGEWEKSQIPKGALAITMHNPNGKESFKDNILEAVSGDRNRPIALICAVGGRSSWAQRYLTANGFTNVLDVSEGMFGRGKQQPGWLRRGLPIEPCPQCTRPQPATLK